MFVHVHVYHWTTADSINKFKSLYFIIPNLEAYRPAPNVTVTLTRQNLEATVYCSKNDRLNVLQIGLLICLRGCSTEQVPAGVLDPCAILRAGNLPPRVPLLGPIRRSKSLFARWHFDRLWRSNFRPKPSLGGGGRSPLSAPTTGRWSATVQDKTIFVWMICA